MSDLTTARLTLKPYTRDDWDTYAALLMGPRSTTLGGPFDVAGAWKCFATDASAQVLSNFGCFIIWKDGLRVGFVGVIHPPDFPEPELGWGLYDGFEGHGYATEAAEAALAHMFATTDRDSFVSYIQPENAPSMAVAHRIGGTVDPAAARPKGWDSTVFRHRRTA